VEPYSPTSGSSAAPAGLSLASIGARAGAWIIDEIIVYLPALIVMYLVMRSRIDVGSSFPSEEELQEAMPAWLPFVPIGFRLVYDAVLVAWLGRTVGMMALRIRVQSAGGDRLAWWQAGIRAMVPALAQTVPVFGTFARIGVYLSASFDERRRGLHDRAAGSLVVAVPRPAPVALPAGYPGWYPGTGLPPPPPPPPPGPPPPPSPGSSSVSPGPDSDPEPDPNTPNGDPSEPAQR
jgi:uncharacterized RDD family membrane protein YckC